jgi:hypothetical protein
MFRHTFNFEKRSHSDFFLHSYTILYPMQKDWRQYGEGGKNRWRNQTKKDSEEE